MIVHYFSSDLLKFITGSVTGQNDSMILECLTQVITCVTQAINGNKKRKLYSSGTPVYNGIKIRQSVNPDLSGTKKSLSGF